MQIQVSGVKMNIGASLEQYVKDNLTAKVEKYFDRSISAIVHITRDAYLYKTSITVNEGVKCGIIINSIASSSDAYSSFDQALSKIAAQLRKYNSKLKDYRSRRAAKDKLLKSIEMSAYNVNPQEEDTTEQFEVEPVDKHAEIIKENVLELENLSVDEAVMKLELSDENAMAFVNKDSDKVTFLYRKQNGQLVMWEV